MQWCEVLTLPLNGRSNLQGRGAERSVGPKFCAAVRPKNESQAHASDVNVMLRHFIYSSQLWDCDMHHDPELYILIYRCILPCYKFTSILSLIRANKSMHTLACILKQLSNSLGPGCSSSFHRGKLLAIWQITWYSASLNFIFHLKIKKNLGYFLLLAIKQGILFCFGCML